MFIILLPECDEGHYGEACQDECGHCADITACHHFNGTCLNGCKRGYMEPYCKTGVVFLINKNILNNVIKNENNDDNAEKYYIE